MDGEEEGEVEFGEGIDDFVAGGSSGPTHDRLGGPRAGGGRRGGAPGDPLTVPGFVSGRISVRDFHDSCGSLLSAFRAELEDCSMEDDSIDVSIDDLKILTDAVLVEKALSEVLKGQNALLKSVASNTYNQSHEGQNNGILRLEYPMAEADNAPEDHLEMIPTFEELGDCQQGAQERQNNGILRLEYPMAEAGNAPEDHLEMIPTSAEELGDCQQGAQEPQQPQALQGLQGSQEPQATASENLRLEFNFSVPPKIGKKRGRPFDRDQRAALLMDNTDAKRKEVLTRMRSERDAARENASLNCLRAKKEREKLYAKDQRPLRTLRFLNTTLRAPKLASKKQFEPMKEGEVLLTVEIYDNMKRSLKTQEFIVCGSQPLTALKDQIYCLTDTVAEKAGFKVPSGYFLIEDSFYNDMRHVKAMDYSLPIRQWVREKAEAIEKWKALGGGRVHKRRWFGLTSSQKSTLPPTFLAGNMDEVSFMDIECRLGAQFLYCHQGDCKHTIVIRDMRLVHPEDVQNAAAYPVLRYVHKLRYRKCTICSIYQASKVTIGDKLAPDSPCFFCDNCYYLLHYSSDGTILYDDFQVHDYYHEQA